jgi:hypothetical protein
MNILYIGLARTIWLFNFQSMNPTGMSLKVVIEEIAKRYQFAQAPKNELDLDEKRSLAFKGGTFVGPRKVPIMVGLDVYNDGMVADTTSSTEESTDFLVDLTSWLAKTYNLMIPKQHAINFLSQIDFQMEASLIHLNRRLEPFVANLEAFAKSRERRYEVGSIQFWTEDIGKPGVPAPVKVERKISAPFDANHYFSQAPVPTPRHIELLNEFEAILKAR